MNSFLCFALTELEENEALAVDVSVPSSAFAAMMEEGELVGPVIVTGTISEHKDEAVFTGNARGRWRLECSRCLVPVETEYALTVEQYAPTGGGSMDLTEEVRQAIVLAQPMKVYCRPDCRGLCPVCQADKNRADCGHT